MEGHMPEIGQTISHCRILEKLGGEMCMSAFAVKRAFND
jgi:hypothetical protein